MTAPGRAGAGAFTNRGNTACLLGSDRGCCAFRFFASPHLCVRLTFLPTVTHPQEQDAFTVGTEHPLS